MYGIERSQRRLGWRKRQQLEFKATNLLFVGSLHWSLDTLASRLSQSLEMQWLAIEQ